MPPFVRLQTPQGEAMYLRVDDIVYFLDLPDTLGGGCEIGLRTRSTLRVADRSRQIIVMLEGLSHATAEGHALPLHDHQ